MEYKRSIWTEKKTKEEEERKRRKEDEILFDKIDAKIRNNFDISKVNKMDNDCFGYKLGKYYVEICGGGYLYLSSRMQDDELIYLNLKLGYDYKQKVDLLYNFIKEKYEEYQEENNKKRIDRYNKNIIDFKNRFDELSERRRYKKNINI